MRTIKFRFWDIENNEFSEEPNYRLLIAKNGQVYNSECDKYFKDRYIVLEYTGFDDKDGNEIYDGDILDDNYTIVEVDFIPFLRNISNSYLRECRIVGNKYKT